MDAEIVAKAKDLAHRAHAGQADKAGRPYIEHVARVAAAVSDDPMAEAVAWLHDVLEDCQEHVEEFWQFPAEITRRVSLLTRIENHHPELYYGRIRKDAIALRVKLEDVRDNADPVRLSKLNMTTRARLSRKYRKASNLLSGDA